jgi:hypothetical protein
LIIGSWLTIFVPGIDNDDENWGGNAQPHETQEKGIDGADLLEMLERNIISEGGAGRRENTTCNREGTSGGNTEDSGRKKRYGVNADQIATKRITIVRKLDTIS